MNRILLFLILVATFPPARGWTQSPGAAPGQAMVETDPIRCWWRTTSGAVMTGETFSVALTCAVVETEEVQVVPDESRLAVAAVQLTPFEIVGGTHSPDLKTGQRRFLQYEYRLRIINPDVIGKDVNLPDLPIHYRVRSRVEADAELQGRDRIYVMPARPIRVLSQVPANASDIRDAAGENFTRVESLGFRAGAFNIAAIALAALGVVMLALALVRVIGSVRSKGRVETGAVSDRSVLRRAAGELSAVQRDAENTGWNEGLSGRALAALRLVGACALDRRVSQGVAAGVTDREGRLEVRRAELRASHVSVSSSVTAEDIARELARASSSGSSQRRQLLEELKTALERFTAMQYGQAAKVDRGALDEAIGNGIRAAKSLERNELKKYFRLRIPRPIASERPA